eukprot:ANDGO_02337.mRNA.1 hypothetical protein ACA1_138350
MSIRAFVAVAVVMASISAVMAVTPASIVCTRNALGQCARGSVQIPAWLESTMRFQRGLTREIPLNELVLPSTHNSAITFADGYGLYQSELSDLTQIAFGRQYKVQISNQWVSLTDQLRMGVRHIELDSHFYDHALRICHAGGVHLEKLDELIEELSKLFKIPIDWDSETLGCFSQHYRTVQDAIQEVRDWQLENPGEFVSLYFDDQQDLIEWDKVPLVVEAILGVFNRSELFTPDDKRALFPTRWPSIAELEAAGKTVVFSSGKTLGNSTQNLWFQPPWWVEFGDQTVQLPNDCGPAGFTDKAAIPRRLVTDGLEYGPFYNGSDVISLPKYQLITRCGINFPSLEFAEPDLMYGSVFTWEEGFAPVQGECVFLNSQTGRWRTQACTASGLVYACEDVNDRMKWTTASAPNGCPSGYQFSVPRDGLQNFVLSQAAKNTWLNLQL